MNKGDRVRFQDFLVPDTSFNYPDKYILNRHSFKEPQAGWFLGWSSVGGQIREESNEVEYLFKVAMIALDDGSCAFREPVAVPVDTIESLFESL